MESFDEFMRRREAAAQAYVNGDAAPVLAMSAQRTMATFFPPGGGQVRGTQEVRERYEHDAASFDSGDSRFEILDMAADDTLGYWVGVQKASVKIKGKAVSFDIRITEIFRREDGQWRMVHRHADAPPPK